MCGMSALLSRERGNDIEDMNYVCDAFDNGRQSAKCQIVSNFLSSVAGEES